MKNLKIFFKIFKAYIYSANPNKYSVAGVLINIVITRYACLGNKKNTVMSDIKLKAVTDQVNHIMIVSLIEILMVNIHLHILYESVAKDQYITDRNECARMKFDK